MRTSGGASAGAATTTRAAQALLAEDVLDEFLDFAAALADQADDDHVGRGVARHHAQQHALADAGAGEQADALAAADGQHRVDRAHAGVQRLAHRVAVHRVDRPARSAARCARRASGPLRSIGAPCESTTRPSRPSPTGRCSVRSSLRRQGWLRRAELQRHDRRRARHDARAAGQAVHVAGGHQVGAVAGEADHLGQHRRLARRMRTSQTEPTGTRMPAASSTRPVTRTSVPCVSSGTGVGGEALQVARGSAASAGRGACRPASACERRGVASRASAPRCVGVGRAAATARRSRCAAAARRQRVSMLASITPMSDSTRQPPRATSASASSRAPRAGERLGRALRRPAAWSSGCTRTRDVAGAQQQRVERLLRRPRRPARAACASSLRTHLARQLRSRSRPARRAISCCSASSWPPKAVDAARRPAPSSAAAKLCLKPSSATRPSR